MQNLDSELKEKIVDWLQSSIQFKVDTYEDYSSDRDQWVKRSVVTVKLDNTHITEFEV